MLVLRQSRDGFAIAALELIEQLLRLLALVLQVRSGGERANVGWGIRRGPVVRGLWAGHTASFRAARARTVGPKEGVSCSGRGDCGGWEDPFPRTGGAPTAPSVKLLGSTYRSR